MVNFSWSRDLPLPCHTHQEKLQFFFLIVRWKPFLFPFLKCHRVQRWQPQVHFSEMWSVDRKRFRVNLAVSPAYWYSVTFAIQQVFFFSSHIPSGLIPTTNKLHRYISWHFWLCKLQLFCHPFVSRCKGNGLKLSRTSGAAEQSGKLE